MAIVVTLDPTARVKCKSFRGQVLQVPNGLQKQNFFRNK